MATGSGSRDVTLTLTVDTLGEEGIKQLQTAISSLAGAGTSAGPEFQKLADQIARLGEQNTALQTVKTLAEQTDKLAQDQEAAAQKAQELATRLDTLKQSAAAAAQKQIEAKDAVNQAKKANVECTAEITKLRSEFDAAGKKTDEYKTKFKELTDKQAEAKKEIIDLRDAQKAANTEYGQAQSAVSKLTSEYERESASAAKAVQATNDKRTALNNAAEQAGKLGVVTTDLATAEGNLIAVFNRGVTAVNERKAALVEMAESDRLLAIQEQAQIELLKRGEQALQAEVLALRDAERSIAAYTAEKAKATADEQAWQREAFAIVEAKEAAQKLARETQILTAAQNELAQQKAFEQLANEAKKMATATEYVRMWETELAAAEAQEKKTAEAAAKIKDAFKDVGVKSVQELEAEIAKTKAAMGTLASESAATGSSLKGAFDAGNAKIKALERDIRELNGTMTLGDQAAKMFSSSIGQFTIGNLAAQAVAVMAMKVGELGREFVSAVIEGDKFTRSLNAIYKDSRLAADQITFLRQSSFDAGIAVGGIEKEFVKFSAAMRSANIPLQMSNDLFAAVTRASGSLGMSAEETAGALTALGQMASKGVVSMEELRQQLGDRLPGAFGLVARGLGITEAELTKLVESGNLATRAMLPGFIEQLNATAGSTAGLNNDLGRFKTILTSISEDAGAATWASAMGVAFRAFGGAVTAAAIGMEWLGDKLALQSKRMAAIAAEMTGHRGAWAAYQEDVEESRKRIDKHIESLNKFLFPSESAAKSAAANAEAHKQLGTAVGSAAVQIGKVEGASQLATAAANLHANATISAERAYTQFGVAAANAMKSQEANTEGLGKLAKAAKTSGDEISKLASLTGEADVAANIAASASTAYALAMDKLATSQEEEAAILKLQLIELEKYRVASGQTEEAVKGQRDELERKLKVSADEATQSRTAATAAKDEAFIRELAAEKLKDHSLQVKEYGIAVEQARKVVDVYTDLEKSGVDVSKEKGDAVRNLAKAESLYKDALSDTIRNTEVELKQTAAVITAKDVLSNNRIKHAEVMLEEAKREGFVVDAIRLENQIKTENIKILERRKELALAEIDAAQKVIDAKRAELTANTDENESKRKLLDVEEELLVARKEGLKSIDEQIKGLKNSKSAVDSLAEAYHRLGIQTPAELQQIAEKNAEAWDKISKDAFASTAQLKTAFEKYAQSAIDAAGDMGREVTEQMLKSEGATRGLNVAIDATGKVSVEAMGKAASAINNARGYMTAFERSAIAATEALEAQNAAVERRISALEKEIELAERAAELERKRQGVDKDGFRVDKDGNRIIIGVPTKAGVFEQAKARGLDEGQALQIANQFIGPDGSQQGWQRTGKSWSVALNEAIEKIILDNAAQSAGKANALANGGTGELGKSSGLSTADRPSVVNINMNGKTRRINTDPSGAQAIQDVLRGLETSSRTTA